MPIVGRRKSHLTLGGRDHPVVVRQRAQSRLRRLEDVGTLLIAKPAWRRRLLGLGQSQPRHGLPESGAFFDAQHLLRLPIASVLLDELGPGPIGIPRIRHDGVVGLEAGEVLLHFLCLSRAAGLLTQHQRAVSLLLGERNLRALHGLAAILGSADGVVPILRAGRRPSRLLVNIGTIAELLISLLGVTGLRDAALRAHSPNDHLLRLLLTVLIRIVIYPSLVRQRDRAPHIRRLTVIIRVRVVPVVPQTGFDTDLILTASGRRQLLHLLLVSLVLVHLQHLQEV